LRIFRRAGERVPLLFIFLFLTHLTGCPAGESFEKQELVIQSGGGKVTLMAEIARTASQREQGLMHRKGLKDGEGMLFVFERDEILSFWMKNTLVPLSIAFIAYDGRILEVHDMQPGNLNPVHSSRSVRYALEVPQGWFNRVGIRPGDKLEINFS
jgi:uncharacterized membrane protein (UPF0127 family)